MARRFGRDPLRLGELGGIWARMRRRPRESTTARIHFRDLSMSTEHRTIPVMQDRSAAAKDCPLAPPANASVYARPLHRACLVLGGVDRLAEHLKVTAPDLVRWLRGEDRPPEAVFLACVEVVLLHAGGPGPAN